jgi:4-aminobutyrate aminotransferase/(S)-3-amino-2-methylpropionate transaminase
METIKADNLVARAGEIERIMLGRLHRMQAEDNRIGDVRGRGAMIAVELVQQDSTEPDPGYTAAVASAAREMGVIVLTCGTYGNVLRFLPPLTISDELLNEGLDVLAEAFATA